MPTSTGGPGFVLNGIDFQILIDGWRKGESIEQGPWRDIVYQVKWDDSDNAIDSLMGLIRPPSGKGGTIKRVPPHQYPGNTILYCLEAEANPIGVPTPDPKLLIRVEGYAHILARYRVPRFDIGGTDTANTPGGVATPWSEWEVDAEDETLNLTTAAVVFETSGNNPAQPFPLRVVQEEMRLTIYQVPFIDLSLVRARLMTLNATIFEGWPIGQAMFRAYSYRRTIASDGTMTQKLVMTFSARSYDWRKMQLDDDNGFDFVKGAKSHTRPYALTDHNDLLNLQLG